MIRSYRLHETQVIGHTAEMRQVLTEMNTALPVPVKIKSRTHQRGMVPNERQSLALEHVVGAFFTIPFDQFWFVRKQVELRWRADHVQVNHVLRARLEMRLLGCRGTGSPGRGKQARIDDRAKPQCADSKSGMFQEFPPAFREVILLSWVHPLVMVSSRFIKILVR